MGLARCGAPPAACTSPGKNGTAWGTPETVKKFRRSLRHSLFPFVDIQDGLRMIPLCKIPTPMRTFPGHCFDRSVFPKALSLATSQADLGWGLPSSVAPGPAPV